MKKAEEFANDLAEASVHCPEAMARILREAERESVAIEKIAWADSYFFEDNSILIYSFEGCVYVDPANEQSVKYLLGWAKSTRNEALQKDARCMLSKLKGAAPMTSAARTPLAKMGRHAAAHARGPAELRCRMGGNREN